MSPKDSFWQHLPRPFFALAPMEDVTDAAFRRLIACKGKPHVFFSEFTSADGLVLASAEGQRALRKKLLFSDDECPIVAQLFSSYPERMEAAAAIVADLGFDGIDINMGCPDRAIEKGKCGAAMMQYPDLARKIIQAAKRGGGGLPVSVKTRIGYARNELDTWLPTLLEEGLAAVTIHARTRNEMSDVPARWEHIREAVAIRDSMKVSTLIMGNGDVRDLADARAKAEESGCDGVMLGRAIYGNPWLFAEDPLVEPGSPNMGEPGSTKSPEDRIEALIEHLQLFDELLGDVVNYATMKKHFKAYISGWPASAGGDSAKDLRARLMETNTVAEAIDILSEAGHSLRS
ncbi:tRNA-dihydrouridine synthase [Candidatus Kaiserbacteria bacterium]|nr:tRNA-dihydrouridine synthase [Candidatus Kaiserbacteria bacterium]